jgi:hypothetical protein
VEVVGELPGGLPGKLGLGAGKSDTGAAGSVEGGSMGKLEGEVSQICSWATDVVVSGEAPPEKEDTPHHYPK